MDLLGLALLLAVGLLLAITASTWHTVYALTHPPRRAYAFAVARSLPGDPSELDRPVAFDSWTFESRGLSLPVWDIRAANPSGPVVIITHGWGESRVVGLARVPALLDTASRIILWDLPGHGDAPGTCSLGTREVDDLRALLARIADRTAPIVLYGSSLGAGVSIVAACQEPRARAVIAEAPYRVPIVPARNVMRAAGLPHLANLPLAMAILGARFGYGMSWSRTGNAGGFDRALHAARLRIPLLVLHGTLDQVCPIDDGRSIAAAAPAPTLGEIAGAGHLNLWTDQPFAARCADEVRSFLGSIAITPSREGAPRSVTGPRP